MASISATEFKGLVGDSKISDENAEAILDLAIDCLNLFGNCDVSNMGGTVGSKTWSGESKQKGAIYLTARTIYEGFYKGRKTVNLPGVSVTTSDVLGNPATLEIIKLAARQLAEFDVAYG